MVSRRRVILGGLVLAVMLVGVPVAHVVTWEIRFASLRADVLPGEMLPQLWAHRGYLGEGAAQNSLDALSAAQRHGFPGVELDLFWAPEHGFIIQHEPPTRAQLAAGNLLTLAQVFARDVPSLCYYLDLKNLTVRNASSVAAHLGELLARHNAMRRAFIESKRWRALAALRGELPAARTLYWLGPYGDVGMLGRFEMRRQTAASKTGAVSIDHAYIDDRFLEDFGHLPIHAFTVNDPDRVRELAGKGVAVVVTDVDLSGVFPRMMARPTR